MIKVLDVMDVRGSVYGTNMDAIKAQMIEKYGPDVRLGYSFRTNEPDQVTVYKVIKEEDIDIQHNSNKHTR